MSARIAKDNARVSRFMDSLVNHIDLIVDAAAADDWQEVARQAEYLAGGGATHGCSELSTRAAELAETLKNPYNAATARRQIVRLIGACGRASIADAQSPMR
jgi:HPt (histidine-containing phosphotransfer) domain-containing protein